MIHIRKTSPRLLHVHKAALRRRGCDLLFVCVVYWVMCALLCFNGVAAATAFHNYGVERRLKCVRVCHCAGGAPSPVPCTPPSCCPKLSTFSNNFGYTLPAVGILCKSNTLLERRLRLKHPTRCLPLRSLWGNGVSLETQRCSFAAWKFYGTYGMRWSDGMIA